MDHHHPLLPKAQNQHLKTAEQAAQCPETLGPPEGTSKRLEDRDLFEKLENIASAGEGPSIMGVQAGDVCLLTGWRLLSKAKASKSWGLKLKHFLFSMGAIYTATSTQKETFLLDFLLVKRRGVALCGSVCFASTTALSELAAREEIEENMSGFHFWLKRSCLLSILELYQKDSARKLKLPPLFCYF